MKSERVLVRIAGAAPGDWRGDDLRFPLGRRGAYARGHDLESSYRHIVDWRIVASEDPPTHTHVDGVLVSISDAGPPGFAPCAPPRGVDWRHVAANLSAFAVIAGLLAVALVRVL